MSEAARVDDTIGHSHALAGMIGGTLVGGLIAAAGAVAAGALFVAGLAASCLGVGVLLIGASLAVGYLTGVAATAARDGIADAGAGSLTPKGNIVTGSSNVFINGKPAAIATVSQVSCNDDGPSMQMAQGSEKVSINGLPAARVGDKTNCDAQVMEGSPNVRIGGGTVTTLPIKPEVPDWLYKASDLTLLFAGLVGGAGGAASKLGALGKMLSKLPGINKLGRIACRFGTLMTATAAAGIIARPVDIVSGQKFLDGEDELDFVLPSRLPVAWQRYWRSGNPGDSVLGRGWSLFWESCLQTYQDGVVWRAPSGDYVAFPMVPRGHKTYCEAEKCWLMHNEDGSWQLFDVGEQSWHYPPLDGEKLSRLVMLTDATGNSISLFYDDQGQLTDLVDSAEQRLTCHYLTTVNGLLRLDTVLLNTPDGYLPLVSYAYDDEGQLIAVTNRAGEISRRFTWRDGLMASHQDRQGLLNEYLWQEIDGLPRVIAWRHNAGEELSLHYDFAGGLRRAVRDDGKQALWQLDDSDNVAQFTDFDGRKTALIYECDELCGVLLPGGAQRQSEWDRYGRLLSKTDPLGRKTTYQYSRNSGRLFSVTYPDGSQVFQHWDALGRLTQQIDALGNTTRYRYSDDKESLPEAIIDALGGEVKLAWNAQGLLTRYSDCSGSVTAYAYDGLGQLTHRTDAEGNLTRYQWDRAGRLERLIHPDSSEERFAWNTHGQLVRHQDPLGSETHWQYNLLGQPVSVTDRINRIRRYHYNCRGWLTNIDNGNGGEYHFSHDAVGRLTSERRPDRTEHFYQYGPDGQLTEHRETGPWDDSTPPAQRLHKFLYDEAGQLAWRGNDSAQLNYHYDAMGRMIRLTRTPTLAGAELGIESDSVQLRYDKAGNLLAEQGVNGELQYQWDALANLKGLTLPQGDQLQWLYYGSGHASAIKFNQQLVSEFTRDRLHRETCRTQGALQQYRQYDALGRRCWQSSDYSYGKITKPEDGVLWRVFRYTGRGELEGVSDALRGEVHYRYDAEGRLLQHREIRLGKTGNRLVYDGADNVLGWQSPNDDVDRHLPLAPITDNRLTHWQQLFYRYDAWGNLVSRRNGMYEQHYRYDADNRLIQALGRGPEGEFEAQYHYDALGRRIRKIISYKGKPAETTCFLWEGYRLLQEQRDNGTRRTWSYDPASAWTPLAAIEQAGDDQQAELYWLHTDLNSAPLEVTDAEGNLRWSGNYDTFGKMQGQTVASIEKRKGALYDQPLRYAGQYQDNESGLHYNLFRYYEPEVGRFITQDPIGLRGGFNLYQYAPNPLGWVDPLGLYRGEGERGLGKYHVFHEHTLDSSEYTLTDKEHFSRANESVYKRLQVDPDFKRELQVKYPGVVEHVQPMKNGKFRGSSPKGMTWHHGDSPGSLQLADFNDHKSYHKIYHPDGTGGRNKWGGGTSCRK
ncbi:RHS repeat-associated core domain-containing protein [Enterobacter ludwigii]|jgi:RHS repeat-associated protein|uniref:RHS repeat-associated core domain-containing protein n=1 Tax=Enterobacter ludwigii TaxID=299767 RepID=UPI00110BF2A5|nr:RHS repeat-associated core domain-containing protein [Enterobacter ludwigii]MDP9945730.1 RHS repeat-associated protein [Enterobacter ludwigii]QCV81450.1 type IV secretion protein Rhs [Enterobacter ludwigii]QDE51625.1 type IV secretion protein Rhs [Enterobacter ludwigii]